MSVLAVASADPCAVAMSAGCVLPSNRSYASCKGPLEASLSPVRRIIHACTCIHTYTHIHTHTVTLRTNSFDKTARKETPEQELYTIL